MRFNTSFWERNIFFALLICIVFTFAIAPFLQEEEAASRLLNVFLVLMLVFSVIIVGDTKISFFVALLLGAPMLISNATAFLYTKEGFPVLVAFSSALFFIYVIVMLLKKIFTSSVIDINIILGAVCVYFLISVVWALLHGLVEAYVPGSYDVAGEQMSSVDMNVFMYYSIVTLTTLGYGDITPLSASARSLAAMEALVGQIYLTVIIARLVGLHMQQKT
ncbi:ion channel [Prosthecochloris sp. SCSIO W1101]|uniref:ion channel n=1 Tax=Prosthecochloris sp. SCSIO W1101 TaxID=2992242 RepID=UPI00223E4CCB|nr:ion channel [Prosthecochloris sp. SCSIO W1101]UZJ42538.1 ion channel [Prosthecochloris sp. SCSIO W1101]